MEAAAMSDPYGIVTQRQDERAGASVWVAAEALEAAAFDLEGVVRSILRRQLEDIGADLETFEHRSETFETVEPRGPRWLAWLLPKRHVTVHGVRYVATGRIRP